MKIKGNFEIDYSLILILMVDVLLISTPLVFPAYATGVSIALIVMLILSLIGVTSDEGKEKIAEGIRKKSNFRKSTTYKVIDIFSDIAFVVVWSLSGFYATALIYLIIGYTIKSESQRIEKSMNENEDSTIV